MNFSRKSGVAEVSMKQVPDSDVYVIPNAQEGARGNDGPSVRELETIARWMDSVFEIPGVGLKFGLDSILGLVPGLGDTVTSVVSLYILKAAHRHGVSRVTMTRMTANILMDYVIGSVPVLGDLFDVYWKANQANVKLLRQHIDANPSAAKTLRKSDWLFFAGLTAVVLVFLVGSLTIAYFLISWMATMFARLMS